MITVNTGKRTFGISFAHPWLKAKRRRPERKTTCTIFELLPNEGSELPSRDWTEIGKSETACSLQDNFQKATGRKKSLQRVLCQHDYTFARNGAWVYGGDRKCKKCGSPRVTTVVLSPDERKTIWDTYFKYLETKPQKPSSQLKVLEGEVVEPVLTDPSEYAVGL